MGVEIKLIFTRTLLSQTENQFLTKDIFKQNSVTISALSSINESRHSLMNLMKTGASTIRQNEKSHHDLTSQRIPGYTVTRSNVTLPSFNRNSMSVLLHLYRARAM